MKMNNFKYNISSCAILSSPWHCKLCSGISVDGASLVSAKFTRKWGVTNKFRVKVRKFQVTILFGDSITISAKEEAKEVCKGNPSKLSKVF